MATLSAPWQDARMMKRHFFHVPANGRLTLFAFDKGVSAGIPFGEEALVGISFGEGVSVGIPFGEGVSAVFPFGEPRQTHFQQISPRQSHIQQAEPREARFRQETPRQTRFRQRAGPRRIAATCPWSDASDLEVVAVLEHAPYGEGSSLVSFFKSSVNMSISSSQMACAKVSMPSELNGASLPFLNTLPVVLGTSPWELVGTPVVFT